MRIAKLIKPTRRRSGVSPVGGRTGGRGPRLRGRSSAAASLVSDSSKKSNSMSLSRSLISVFCRGSGASLYRVPRSSKEFWRAWPKQGRRMSRALEPVAPSGLVLGRYRPLRPLGAGGSGSVWLSRDETTGLEVALKIVAKEGTAAPRAEREAEAATRLRHPHCLRAYGLESDEKHVYIAYEYVPGSTLRQALRAGELGDEGAVEAAAQVLEGLAFAHARGIVHRDVKPSNVLVAEEEGISVRLFDFGLAQLADAETLTAVGDVPGTLAYISPERLHGETAGPPADVWAVGVLLWEALSGHHPFWRASPLETGEVIKTGAPSIGEVRPDLPRRLVAAVDRALSVNPARRPPAGALSRELRAAWLERAPRRKRPKAPVRIDPKPVLVQSAAPGLAALV